MTPGLMSASRAARESARFHAWCAGENLIGAQRNPDLADYYERDARDAALKSWADTLEARQLTREDVRT